MRVPAAAVLLIFLAYFCQASSPAVTPAHLDSIMAATPLTQIEGVWKLLPDNASIAIIRQPGQNGAAGPLDFNIYLYSTVTARIAPGTLIGTLSATPVEQEYKASMVLNPLTPSSRKEQDFIFKLNGPAHISFIKENSGISVNLWRIVPYLFRISVTQNKPRGSEGCIKIHPLVPGVSEPVRHL